MAFQRFRFTGGNFCGPQGTVIGAALIGAAAVPAAGAAAPFLFAVGLGMVLGAGAGWLYIEITEPEPPKPAKVSEGSDVQDQDIEFPDQMIGDPPSDADLQDAVASGDYSDFIIGDPFVDIPDSPPESGVPGDSLGSIGTGGDDGGFGFGV